jgi:tetratricopeptide (TPR) repeat protein/TolB-like protein
MRNNQILDSWKEITHYLKRSRKTCIRFEKELDLPIHRLDDTPKSRVYAYKDELDRWMDKKLKKTLLQSAPSQIFPNKKKSIILGISVVSILLLLVLGIIFLKPFSKGEISLDSMDKPSLAVISFDNQTGEKGYDYLCNTIPNLLITSLENSGFIYVVTWERMFDLLDQAGKPDVVFIDRDMGFEMCRKEGIGALVLGSFSNSGDTFTTEMKVIDTKTNKLLMSARSNGKGAQSILQSQIDALSVKIIRILGVPEEQITKLKVSDITTTSIDAYKQFLLGIEASENQNYDKAISYFESAVKKDPSFASAYFYLAPNFSVQGRPESQNESYEKAKFYAKKAPEKERSYIESAYANAIEYNHEKMFHILERMATDYPREKRVHFRLAQYYLRQKLYDKAIEEYNVALTLDPDYGSALNELAYLYMYKGDYENAIEHFEKYKAVSPGDPNPLDSMASCYFSMGKLDVAVALYKGALKVKKDWRYGYWGLSYIFAFKENYAEAMKWTEQSISILPSPYGIAGSHLFKGFLCFWLGRLDQALSEYRRASDLSESAEMYLIKGWADWMAGFVYYEKGEFDLARRSWDSLDDSTESQSNTESKIRKNLWLGLVDIKQGKLDSAKLRLTNIESYLSELTPNVRDYYELNYHLLNAELLLAKGSNNEAISIGKKISPIGVRGLPSLFIALRNLPYLSDVLARSYWQKGDLNKAISEYERLLAFDPASNDRRLIHPKYHYRLGKLYEEKGQELKAIEQYEKFLELWKDTVPGLSEVKDANIRLTRLITQ